jgi:DNA-directed RNA polymerase specialized sigma24 family protein
MGARRAAADDLTAEVFLRMVEGLPHYQQNGAPFEAWLYRIAAARVADFYRAQSCHPQEAVDAELTGLSRRKGSCKTKKNRPNCGPLAS